LLRPAYQASLLRTLEATLLTRELRADVGIMVQLDNPAVGRALFSMR
jgi:hypothetical protein